MPIISTGTNKVSTFKREVFPLFLVMNVSLHVFFSGITSIIIIHSLSTTDFLLKLRNLI